MSRADGNAARIGAYIAGARNRQMPEAVIDAARLCLADWLAVAVGARTEDAGRTVREVVAGWQADGHARVIFGGQTAAPFAALANGTLAHCLDFDDTYIPAVTHTSAPVWAAVLALGQQSGASEMEMLRAFVTGFEVAGRVGEGLGEGLTARGLHSTGAFGRIGAAAACATLLGLDAARAQHAVAAAATQISGLTLSFGTMAKPFHAGKAAMDGVLSAQLAERGFTGAAALLEPGGIDRAYIQDGSITMKSVDFGDWRILANSFKPYAACHLVHPAVDAARQMGVSPAQIAEARVRVSPLCMKVTGAADGAPSTPLAAKFDLRYCIALGFHGHTVSAGDFRDPWTADTGAVDTARHISAEAGADVGIAAARLEVRTRDGRSLVTDIPVAKGHPGNPMRWDDMGSKMSGLVAAELGERTGDLLAAAQSFGDDTALPRIMTLIDALDAAPGGAAQPGGDRLGHATRH